VNGKRIGILLLLVVVCGAVALRVWRIAQPAKVTTKSADLPLIVIPPPQPETPKYRKALRVYLAKIDSIKRAKKEQRDEVIKGSRPRHRQRDKRIADTEAARLQRLEKEAAENHGKVGLEEECEGMKAYSATSSASARIFLQLVKEGNVDEPALVSMLGSETYHMDKAWIPVLQHIADSAKEDSALQRSCIRDLYKLGVSKDKYRRVIEQWADGPVTFLFEYDKDTGDPIPVRSSENLSLMRSLSDKHSSPRTRAACALYAALIGERAFAQQICTEILWTPYKLRGAESNDDPDDSRLYFAKLSVLDTLFFEVGGKEAFRQVYERANLRSTISRYRESLPEGLKYYSIYPRGDLEVGHAQGLISEVGVDLSF
jgi:hypothetical protein